MKIAIIDDEKVFREMIKNELCKEYPKKDIDCFSSAEEFVDTEKYYDLVLLDIEMPGINGIQFAKENKLRIPNLIYVTSYTEYMPEAFDKNVIGFIAKNQLETKLLVKVKEAEKTINNVDNLTVRTLNQEKRIPRKDILYFSLEKGFVYMKTTTDKHILNYTSLAQLKDVLNDYFLLVNRNYIVNVENVESIDKEHRTITFEDGFRIKVSGRKWPHFKRIYIKVVKVI